MAQATTARIIRKGGAPAPIVKRTAPVVATRARASKQAPAAPAVATKARASKQVPAAPESGWQDYKNRLFDAGSRGENPWGENSQTGIAFTMIKQGYTKGQIVAHLMKEFPNLAGNEPLAIRQLAIVKRYTGLEASEGVATRARAARAVAPAPAVTTRARASKQAPAAPAVARRTR